MHHLSQVLSSQMLGQPASGVPKGLSLAKRSQERATLPTWHVIRLPVTFGDSPEALSPNSYSQM